MKSAGILKHVIALGLAVVLGACNADSDAPEPDTTAPVITVPNADNLTLSASRGDTFQLEVLTTDDQALSQLKANIHPADGHSHDKTALALLWNKTYPLDGSSQALTIEVPIAGDITPGTYHFMLQLVDAAGNEAPYFHRDLLVRSAKPRLSPGSFALNGADPASLVLDFSTSDSLPLRFQGAVTDDGRLDDVTLYLAYDSHTFDAMASNKTAHLGLYTHPLNVPADADSLAVDHTLMLHKSTLSGVAQQLGAQPAEVPDWLFTVAIGATDDEGQQAFVAVQNIRVSGLGFLKP